MGHATESMPAFLSEPGSCGPLQFAEAGSLVEDSDAKFLAALQAELLARGLFRTLAVLKEEMEDQAAMENETARALEVPALLLPWGTEKEEAGSFGEIRRARDAEGGRVEGLGAERSKALCWERGFEVLEDKNRSSINAWLGAEANQPATLSLSSGIGEKDEALLTCARVLAALEL